MAEVSTKDIVEALIMAADDPLSLDRISKILNSNNHPVEMKELRDVVNELVADYSDHSLELKEVASGWRFQIKSDLSFWIGKLHEERPPRYSRALLETLSLIAYRQPITRSEIEDVRGVGVSSNIVRTLLDHEWIKIIGHKEVPGRPALFATTKKFLDHFNLKHLNELPPLEEFTEEVAEGFVEELEVEEKEKSSDEENLLDIDTDSETVVMSLVTDDEEDDSDVVEEVYYDDDNEEHDEEEFSDDVEDLDSLIASEECDQEEIQED